MNMHDRFDDLRPTAPLEAYADDMQADRFPGGPDSKPAKPSVAFKFVAVGDLQFHPPEYIVQDLIETESLGLIFGDPGCGKSFIAVDLALSVATGADFHGRATTQGPVFFIAGEGHNGLARRFAAWAQENGTKLTDVPLFKSERAAQFLDMANAAAVAAAVDNLASVHGRPALIVIDTVARNFGAGDENSTQSMGEFITAIDDLKARYPGCTVLLIHHSGHADKQRARGAMALKGALDFEFRAEKDGPRMMMTNTKTKDAEPPETMHFTLEGVDLGEGASSAVLRETDAPQGQKKLTPTQKMAMETYTDAAAEAGAWDNGGFRGVHVDDWRPRFYSKHTGDTAESKKKAFQRVRGDLVEKGQLVVTDDVYFTKDADLQTAIMRQRDKRDIAGHSEKCPGAEGGNAGTSGTSP
jgi:hypothetical protein